MEQSDHQVSLKSCRKTGPGGLLRPMSDGGLVLGGTLPPQRLSASGSDDFKASLNKKLSVGVISRPSQRGGLQGVPEVDVEIRNRLEVPSSGFTSSSSSLERDDQPVKVMRGSWEILVDHVKRDSILGAGSPPPHDQGEEPSFHEVKKAVKNIPEMNKLRSGMEAQLAALDDRLKMQEQEVADIVEIVKKRAEIEKRYGKELEGLADKMRGKHKDMMGSHSSGSSVSQILRKLILETGDLARDHGSLDEVLSTEMIGICHDILSDVQFQHKQCRQAGQEIEGNVMRTLFDLQNKNKVLHKCKSNYNQAEKKFLEVSREVNKLEKEIKPEKREKSNKYQEKKKMHMTKLERLEDAKDQAIEAQLSHTLSLEAANESVDKNYRTEISDLMDCLDLSYHHHIKHLVAVYSEARATMVSNIQQHDTSLDSVTNNLNARSDKMSFLQSQPAFSHEPEPFKHERPTQQFQSSQEDMSTLKQKICEKIVHLTSISKELETELENLESKLLQTFKTNLQTNCDMTKYFGNKQEIKRADPQGDSQHLQEQIIEKNKSLIIVHNRIVQEEAKYNYLKNSLVSLTQNQSLDTLPRPHITRKKMKTQTAGLATVFGGSLDEYFEATGEKIPLVIESCIKYINTYGMRHQGIFRIGGAHADINKYEEEFEKGSDPFSALVNGNYINSVSSVLGRYFRKLRQPLFGEAFFDQLMSITRNHPPPPVLSVSEKKERNIGSDSDFVKQTQIVVQNWSEPHIIVSRYFFAFLHDLSQFSDDTQMDSHNLAVCFGPTLCPIPPGRDLVLHTTLVNDLIKNFIIFCHDIFAFEIDGPVYRPRQFGEAEDGHEEEDEDGHDFVDAETETNETSSLSEASPLVEDRPIVKLRAVAEHDFASDNPKVLSLKAKDVLELHTKASPDWWRGSREGVEGLIAAKYVRVLEEKKDIIREEEEEEDDGVETKHMSFNTSRNMWAQKTLEKRRSKDRAPDLLQDVPEMTGPGQTEPVSLEKAAKKRGTVFQNTAV